MSNDIKDKNTIMILKKITMALLAFFYVGAISQISAISLEENPQRRDVKFEGNAVMAKILDSSSDEAVAFATAYISKDGTTKNAFYALTNDKGVVVIDRLPLGNFILKVELLGYKAITKNVEVKQGLNRIGQLKMNPDIEQLANAEVTAVGNPIVVKKDTIEYTASSFKTTENDMLEALLKKLPGVEIGSDGTITANGETITKITIDGKTFFLDDPQLALKNIPAKMVDKVKVVEKKSEQSQFTGIDDGDSETVIDLSVKPGMMKGWFGSVGGGAGHDIDGSTGNKNDVRYEGAAMVGKFTKDSQISIIANGNNTNNRGFNDLAGDMMQTMKASIGGGLRGQGGAGASGNDGISTSWLGGVNGAINLLEGDLELEGNYLYNGTDKYFWQKSERVSFLPDNVNMVSNNENKQYSLNQGHRAGVEIDYKLNDKTSFWFRPQFNYGWGRFNEESVFDSYKFNTLDGVENSELKLNDGNNTSSGTNNSWKTDGMLLYRQKIGSTAGRTLSMFVRYNISESGMDAINKSTTNTYDSEGDALGANVIDQNYKLDQSAYSVMGKLTYTEPLGKNYFLQGSYRYSWSENNSDKKTYDFNEASGIYDKFNNIYSTNFKNTFLNQDIGLEAVKQEEKFTIQLGVTAQPYSTISLQKGTLENTSSGLQTLRDTTVSGWNFAPSARFDYKFSKTSFLRVRYRGWTNQPSISQLQPVPDNTNPLYIKLGNANLKPEFNQFLFGMYRMSDPKSFFSMHTMMRLMYTKDGIINASWYNNSGVQLSAPINSAEGKYSGFFRFMLNSPIAKSKFSVSSYTDMNVSSGLSYTGVGEADNVYDIMSSLISGRTTTLKVSEKLQFTYRNNLFEANLGARAQYQNAWYTEKSQAKPSTWNNQAFASITATLPFGMEIKTNADYNFYFGYIDGYGDSQVIWNAEISQMLFKKKASLTLKVYDILNQARNVYRVNTDNYVEDVVNNTLGRYFTLSFIYRFGKSNKNTSKGHGSMMYRPGPGYGHR